MSKKLDMVSIFNRDLKINTSDSRFYASVLSFNDELYKLPNRNTLQVFLWSFDEISRGLSKLEIRRSDEEILFYNKPNESWIAIPESLKGFLGESCMVDVSNANQVKLSSRGYDWFLPIEFIKSANLENTITTRSVICELATQGEQISIDSLSEKQKYIYKNLKQLKRYLYILSIKKGSKDLLKILELLGIRTDIEHVKDGITAQGEDLLLKAMENEICNPGYRLKTSFKDKINKLYDEKRPVKSDLGQWLGIEIECLMPVENYSSFENDLVKNGLSTKVFIGDDGSIESDNGDNICDVYNARNGGNSSDNCGDEDCDGCCDCNSEASYVGFEAKLIMKYGEWDILEKLCKCLKASHAFVNDTCGLHVHFDQRDITQRAAIVKGNRIAKAMKQMLQILPQSRRNNSFCKNITSGGIDGDRYSCVNLTALDKYKTIEIRAHSGTVNFIKIKNWIKFCRYTMNVTSKSYKTIYDVVKFCIPKYETDLIAYIFDRLGKFSPELVVKNVEDSIKTDLQKELRHLCETLDFKVKNASWESSEDSRYYDTVA